MRLNLVKLRRFWILLLTCVIAPAVSYAQTDFPTVFPLPVLVLSQDELFSESLLGKAIQEMEKVEADALLADGRRIEEAFKAEDADLTERRPTMDPDDFRALADDFDVRVEASRAKQIQDANEAQQRAEARRRKFLEVAGPVLGRLLAKYQATALLDQRSVLLFNRNMDVTQEAINILDQAYLDDPDMLSTIQEE